jgi:hypothetical protein
MMDLRVGTGRGVRVAIVDTGVVAGHPHVGAVAEGFGVEAGDGGVRLVPDFRDRHGHGTACAGVIRWIAPDAEIVAVRVLDERLTASAEAMEAALSHLERLDVRIANLSLGAPREGVRRRLALATERLRERGVVVVAAVRPDGMPSWPSDQPGVIAVGTDPSLREWEYRRGEAGEPDFFASGYPRPIPGRPPAMNLAGPSFAAPRIAAFAARALELAPSLHPAAMLQALAEAAGSELAGGGTDFDLRHGSGAGTAAPRPDRR